MNLTGATITIRARMPEATRAGGPAAIRDFYRDCINAMNRASTALEAGGVMLTGHGYNAAAGDVMIKGIATNGRRAVVDDIRTIGEE